MSPFSSPTVQQFSSALSTRPNTAEAIDEVCRTARQQLDAPPNLAFVFVSHHHSGQFDTLAEKTCEKTGTEILLGATGESIAGTGREVEQEPAIALWLANLPSTTLTPIRLSFEQTPDGGSILGWPDSLGEPWPDGSAMILLGEPYSFPADFLLEQLNEGRPGVPVIGAMASGGASPGENRLFLGKEMLEGGAVALVLHGATTVTTLVSQGCRPIGPTFVITAAERNEIRELGGKPALEQLQAVFEELPTSDQERVQSGLHVGRVVSEYQDHREQGDFLVRNVMGVQRQDGSIVVGDFMRVGQTVQFHVRDESTADAELRSLLAGVKDREPGAALLFTCNGRGTRLFGEADHDVRCIGDALGAIPLAGFFAQGEIGPVAGRNFTHGFTASLAIFGIQG